MRLYHLSILKTSWGFTYHILLKSLFLTVGTNQWCPTLSCNTLGSFCSCYFLSLKFSSSSPFSFYQNLTYLLRLTQILPFLLSLPGPCLISPSFIQFPVITATTNAFLSSLDYSCGTCHRLRAGALPLDVPGPKASCLLIAPVTLDKLLNHSKPHLKWEQYHSPSRMVLMIKVIVYAESFS